MEGRQVKPELAKALPKCRLCGKPAHPASAHVIGDHPNTTEVPDTWNHPAPKSLLDGIYCSSACVVASWQRMQNEIDMMRGHPPQEEGPLDDDDEEWWKNESE